MSLIRFADFLADSRTEELWRDGRRVRLPRQSFQILIALTRAPGELVTRESLQAQLWPATSQVEWEQGLNAAVNRLRDALGDSAAEPKFIETLPRRGYRFIGRVVQEPPGGAEIPVVATVAPNVTPSVAAALAPNVPATAAPNMADSAAAATVQAAPPADLATPPAPPRGRARWRAATAIALVAAVAVVFAVAKWAVDRDAPAEFAPIRLAPFTALPGEERAPAFSPDGTRMAFAWNGGPGGRGFDLYVKARNSEQLLRLTQLPARALSPAWSPDGASIAFVRQLDGHDGLFLVPALGGPERRLAEAALADPPFQQIAWSPDGRTLAYSSYEAGAHELRLLDVATLAVKPLEFAPECWLTGMPAFSADGHRIAFACTTSIGVYGVYVATLGGKPARRATVMGEARGLAWDSDDSSLIVANDAGDGGALWRLTAGGALQRLPFGEEGTAPALAHGGALAYVRGRQAVEIWRMDLTAADPAASAQRLISSTRAELTPRFSADSTRIAFESNRTGSTEIWMTDASGGGAVRLTQFGGPLTGAPAWCADNRRVAFDSRVTGESALYVVDIDARQPQRVGAADAKLSLPAWSADCRVLLGSNGRNRLFKLPVGGGAAVPFTDKPSYLAQVTGERAVFNVTQASSVTLWQKPVAGGDEQPLARLPALSYNDAWAVADAGVYFTTQSAGATSLAFYEFATGAVRRLATLPKAPAPGGGLGIAVSHDGHWLLYGQGRDAESDIMVVEPAR